MMTGQGTRGLTNLVLERPMPVLLGVALAIQLLAILAITRFGLTTVGLGLGVVALGPVLFASLTRTLALFVIILMVAQLPGARFPYVPFAYRDIIAIGFLGLGAFHVIRRRLDRGDLSWPRGAYRTVWVLLIVWTIVAAIRGLWLDNPTGAWRFELLHAALYGSFFLTLEAVRRPRDARLLLFALLVGMAGVFLEYALAGAYRQVFGFHAGRLVSQQANLVVPVAPFLVALYLAGGRRAWMWLLGLIPLGVVVLLSQQRSIMLALPVTIAVTLVMACRAPAVRRTRMLGLATGLALAAGVSWALLGSFGAARSGPSVAETAGERFGALGRGERTASLAIRVVSYVHVWENRIRKEPIIGWGLGDTAAIPILRGASNTTIRVDSSYITLIWKSGVVGAGLFLLLYLAAIRRTWSLVRHPHPEAQILAIGVSGALVGVLVLALAATIITHYRFNAIWGILLAMPAVADRVYPRSVGSGA